MRIVKFELLKFAKSAYCIVTLCIMLLGLVTPLVEYAVWKREIGGDEFLFRQKASEFEHQQIDLSVTKDDLDALIRQVTLGLTPEEKLDHAILLDRTKVAYRLHAWDIYFADTDNRQNRPDKYFNTPGIERIFSTSLGNYGVLVICLVILILLNAPLYSSENANDMVDVIISRKHGRRDILRAKHLASSILTFIMLSLFYWLTTIIYLTVFKDWGHLGIPAMNVTPGNALPGIVFPTISVGDLLSLGYLCFISSGLALSGLLCMISNMQRNVIGSIGISILAVYLPIVASRLSFSWLFSLYPSISMQIMDLFGIFYFIELFGYSIPQFVPVLVFNVLLYIISFIFTTTFSLFGKRGTCK